MTQADHHDLIVVGTGDDQGQILELLVEGVEQGELLRPVRRVIHGVEVESQCQRGMSEGSDELIDEHLAQSFQRGDVDLVLEAGQRGLAARSSSSGKRSAMSLKTGSVRKVSWSFWSSYPARMPKMRDRTISRKV